MTQNREDAAYILAEVRNRPYYETSVARLMARIKELDDAIASATDPRSPNGGQDVRVKGGTVRVKVPGHGKSSGAIIAELVTAQGEAESRLHAFQWLLERAKSYERALLNSDDAEFAAAFFRGDAYRDICREHHCTNPYDRMVRLIRRSI